MQQNELNKFVKDTPDIGKDIDSRLMYLYSHEKPYLNDPHFKEISNEQRLKVRPAPWQIEQEQIRYIHNHLNIYKDYQKTVDGFPDDTLWLDKKRLGAEPGYQNVPDDTLWLDKKRLGVTDENVSLDNVKFENENVNLNVIVPVKSA